MAKNADSCCWPGCRNGHTIVHHEQGKVLPMCDKHWEQFASESDNVRARAYKTLGVKMPEPLNAPIPREDKKKSEGKKKTVVHHCDCGNCKEYPIVMVKGKSLCEKHWGMLRSSKADRAWSVRNMLGWNKELPAVTVIEELKNDKALNKKKKKVEESWADSEDNEDIDQKVARDIEQSDSSVQNNSSVQKNSEEDDFLSRLADGEFDVED